MSRDELKKAVDSFSERGNFERAWAEAEVSAHRAWGRRAVVPALAAAAVLAFVGWSTFAPEDPAAGLGLEAGEEREEGVHLGVGNSAIYEGDREITAITVVDPEIVHVGSLGLPGQFQIQGLRAGRTDMVVEFVDGESEIETYWVQEAFDPDLADSTLAVGEGTYVPVEVDYVPTAMSLVKPEIAEIQSLGQAKRFAIRGLEVGGTDLVLMSADGVEEVIAVQVLDTPLAVENTSTMAVGEARVWDIPRPINVMSAEPDVVSVSVSQGALMLSAHEIGVADLLVSYPDEVEHYRVIVE